MSGGFLGIIPPYFFFTTSSYKVSLLLRFLALHHLQIGMVADLKVLVRFQEHPPINLSCMVWVRNKSKNLEVLVRFANQKVRFANQKVEGAGVIREQVE